jgi:xylan 1,4-beta-xylosidase
MNSKLRVLFLLGLACSGLNAVAQTEVVAITVDAEKTIGEMRPIWAWFGYDEPNYTYMKDGRKLLTEIAALSPVPVYVRTHNLLTSGDGVAALKWGSTNAYTEDEKGNPVYSWVIVDSVMDTYLERGMKPLVEIGFMPEALSVKPRPYRHSWNTDQPYNNIYTGWSYPPKNYSKWAELVFQWVRHSIDRYGLEEVTRWKWELWNEPNIKYWQGTFDEYCKLYDYTADAVKRACPDCSMGGPHTTNPNGESAEKYLRDFLQHCVSGKNYATGRVGSPIDFIAFHAKGAPKVVDDHVRMNMSPQLDAVATGFGVVASFPELKDLPVIIGECDPEGCAACSMQNHPQNAYRNGTMYSSYTAASYARIYDLMDQYDINLEGAVTWAFEFEGQRWFDGFRDLATNGVDKPVLNVFRMFGMMQGDRIAADTPGAITADEIISSGHRQDSPDIHAIASRDDHSIAIMVWNYHDDSRPAAPSPVELQVKGIPAGRALLHHYRIDSAHSNSYETWKRMGSPQDVTAAQYKMLEASGQLQLMGSPQWIACEKGETKFNLALPRHGVSLFRFSY